MPRKAAPRTLDAHGCTPAARRRRRVATEEQPDDRDADERGHDPDDLQRQLEGVIDDALAKGRRCRCGRLRRPRSASRWPAGRSRRRRPSTWRSCSRRRSRAPGRAEPSSASRPTGSSSAPATAKIAIAIMKGQFSARLPRASTIASSLFAMKVSAIQAMPKSAIIATMPDLKIVRDRDRRRLHVAEEDDQRGRGEHEHLDQRRDGHRLDAAALGGDRGP